MDAFTGVRRAAAGGGESAVCGCVWALCCAPGTVTGRSFLISDSSFGVVARIVPIVALFAPVPTPSPKVTLWRPRGLKELRIEDRGMKANRQNVRLQCGPDREAGASGGQRGG